MLFLYTFHNNTLQNDLQLHLRYRNSIRNKEAEIKYCSCTKKVFTLPVSVTSTYTEGEPTFLRQKNQILQKILSGVEKAVNFKDF